MGIAHQYINGALFFLVLGFGSFYQLLDNSKRFLVVGCLWLLTTHFFVLYPLCQIIIDYAHGQFRVLLFILLILYTTFSGLFFLWGYVLCAQRNASRLIKPFLFSVFLTVYYFFLMEYSLELVGLEINCALFYPLLPALYQKTIINYLISLSPWGAVLFFLLVSGYCISNMYKKKWVTGLASLAFIGFLQIPLQKPPQPDWFEKIGFLDVQLLQSTSGAWNQAELILQGIEKIRMAYPEKKLIIAPESTFSHALNEYPVFVSLWSEYGLKDISLIIGAHRKQNGLYNCAYLIEDDAIKQYYDKQKCMPFSERSAGRFYEKVASFFSNGIIPFDSTANAHNLFKTKVHGMPAWAVLICSEFLCTTSTNFTESLILCLANDSWFCTAQGKKAMFCMALLRATQVHATVLYVSHSIAALINSNGAAHIIKH